MNRYPDPDVQFSDSTGAALAGAQLFFYASGTSTKLNTYSDAALSIANTNPVVLDANGRAGAIFLQNLRYKVVLAPSTDTDPPTSPIWTQDPVYTSDFSTVAQVQGVNGSPNGQLAGTAASAGIPASMAWDFANNILYIATVTGSSSTTVWTAINASTAAAVVPQPQGRLTLTTGTPVIAADVIAATTVFYTPYSGLLVPIYNGTSFVPTSIVAELNATLVASHVASNIYDFYVFLLNGVATLGTGPSWSAGTAGSITAGSCARGTGASGAALTRLQGIFVNAVSMTMRYGNGTTTTAVPANQATYVGSMFVDGTNGQVSCHLSYGQSRKYGLWNAYNRQPIVLLAGDPVTANWNYSVATIHPSNGDTTNTLTSFAGLAEEWVFSTFNQFIRINTNNTSGDQRIGIGYNVTNAFSGTIGRLFFNVATAVVSFSGSNEVAQFDAAPSLGINNINACESTVVAATTNTFFGTQANMLLRATWRG
jgi:hypothetical protein